MVSSVDLFYLCKEFEELVDAKIDNIYQPDEKSIVLRFYKSEFGKKELFLRPPTAIHYTTKRPPTEVPYTLCAALRKRLLNKRVKAVTQLGFSRIIQIDLGEYKLITELFDKGNIILTDNLDKIQLVSDTQRWKERTLAVKEAYSYQTIPHPLDLEKKQLQELFSEGTISKNLATKVALGGFYAQIVCDHIHIDSQTEKPSIAKIMEGLTWLFTQKLNPQVLEDGTPVPFALPQNEKEQKPLDSFSVGFDTIEPKKIIIKKSKSEKIIEAQEKQIQKMQEEIEKNTKIGEFIYEHFTELQTLLDLIKADKPPKQCIVNKKDKTVTFEVKP